MKKLLFLMLFIVASTSFGGSSIVKEFNKIYLKDTTSVNKIGITPPVLGSSYNLTLPTSDGVVGQVLTTDGSGVLNWSTPSSGSSSSGISGAIQFSDGSGGFSSDATNLFWNDSSNKLNISIGSNGTVAEFGTGAFLSSFLADGFFSSGATLNSGGAWTATQTSSSISYFSSALEPGTFIVFGDTGLTPSASFSPTPRFRVKPTGVVEVSGGELRINGSSSGYVGLKSPAAPTSHTYTLPSSDGTSGYFLQTDGLGNLSWASAGGGGANTTLSNLTAPTAVNQDLIFNKSNAFLKTGDANPSQNLTIETGNAVATLSGNLVLRSGTSDNVNTGSTTVSTGANTGGSLTGALLLSTGINSGTSGSGAITLASGNVTGASSAVASGAVNINSGSQAGTAASGAISIISGNKTTTGSSGAMRFESGTTGASTSGSVTVKSGNSGSGLAGAVNITGGSSSSASQGGTINITAGTNSGAGASGAVVISSGSKASGTSGSVQMYSYGTSGITSGGATFKTGDAAASGIWFGGSGSATGTTGSGAVNLTSGQATGTGRSGNITLRSGQTLTSKSGDLFVQSGSGISGSTGDTYYGSSDAGDQATNTSGNVSIASGGAYWSNIGTGSLTMKTGLINQVGTTGATGSISMFTGDQTGSGNSGSISIYTGASTAGVRGDITLGAKKIRTGSASTEGLIFPLLAADPATPEEGQTYFNTTTKKLRLYDGTIWVDLN